MAGRLRPASPFALMYAIVSAILRRMETLVGDLARRLLEQRVMADSEEQRVISAAEEEPEGFLTALFTARHELLTIRTMAAQGGEIYGRAITLSTSRRKKGSSR